MTTSRTEALQARRSCASSLKLSPSPFSIVPGRRLAVRRAEINKEFLGASNQHGSRPKFSTHHGHFTITSNTVSKVTWLLLHQCSQSSCSLLTFPTDNKATWSCSNPQHLSIICVFLSNFCRLIDLFSSYHSFAVLSIFCHLINIFSSYQTFVIYFLRYLLTI